MKGSLPVDFRKDHLIAPNQTRSALLHEHLPCTRRHAPFGQMGTQAATVPSSTGTDT